MHTHEMHSHLYDNLLRALIAYELELEPGKRESD